LLNYRRLGKARAAWMTALAGLLVSLALAAVVLAVPNSPPGLAIALPLFLVTWGVGKWLQEALFDEHLRIGGRHESGWAAAGWALIAAVLYLGIVLGVGAAYDFCFVEGLGEEVDFGNGESVYYSKGATEGDARALGAFLRECGFFDGQSGNTVRLSKDHDGVTLSLVVNPTALYDPGMEEACRILGRGASRRAFDNMPVTIHLCDKELNVKKTIAAAP